MTCLFLGYTFLQEEMYGEGNVVYCDLIGLKD